MAGGRRASSIGRIVWVVVWGAGMIFAGLAMVAAARDGAWPVAAFLLIWTAIAALALVRVGAGLFRDERPKPPRPPRGGWHDEMPDRGGR